MSDSIGDVHCYDARARAASWSATCHEKKINTVSIHPSEKHIFCTGGLDRVVKVWDARMIGKKNKKASPPIAILT